MPAVRVQELADYVGFRPPDQARVAALRPYVEPHFARVVDRFYDEILKRPAVRAVLGDGPEVVCRLKVSLREWLKAFFTGPYDEDYWRHRRRIGEVHVRVGVEPRYTLAALEVVRQEIESVVIESGLPEPVEHLSAVCKLLALEAAVMLDSYSEGYGEQVRQLERSAVQERLTQSEHLARIGRLAASLAHEIKNPLAGISGAIQVIRDALRPDDPHRPVLVEILRQINRLDGTVKDLLVYARPKTPRIETCEPERIMERVRAVLLREPDFQRIRLEHVAVGPPFTFRADEDQMEQLLLNLLLNAAHATPDGRAVRLVTSLSGQEVRLMVEDQGHGMDEPTRQRAFEPFFTTKARGTGLGLSICQRIVESHGGTISIQSQRDKGTTVTVRLPRRGPEDVETGQ